MALGLGAAAWACGRGGSDAPSPTVASARDLLTVALTTPMLAKGDTRLAFAIIDGGKPTVGEDVRVSLQPPSGPAVRAEPTLQKIRTGLGGDADAQGAEVYDIYVMRHRFAAAGNWVVDVRSGGRRGQGAFRFVDEDPAPQVGEPAVSVGSPTVADGLGVDPICTRTPQCSMHDVTIAEAIEAKRPLVVTFGTPKFCTSRTCGPVVDIIEEAKGRVGDRAAFVHVEAWRNDDDAVGDPDGYAPAFLAWRLNTEPYTFFVGPDGTVKERWAGAIGEAETSAAVEALVAGNL